MKLWELSADDIDTRAEAVMSRGTQYQLANGRMGYRGTLDEFGPEQQVALTLAGVYDQVGSAWREPVNAPNPGYTQVTVDGVALSALDETVVSHSQRVRFANAVFERETQFKVEGKVVTLRSSRFLSAADPMLGIVRFSVCCDAAAKVELCSGIDGNIWDLNGPHLPELSFETKEATLVATGRTQEQGRLIAVAKGIDASGLPAFETEDVIEKNKSLRAFRFEAKAGEVYSIDCYFAVGVEAEAEIQNPVKAALEVVSKSMACGYESCLEAHETVWEQKWSVSDVVIEGDDEAQLALRYSIFQLLLVAPVEGSGNSIPARALSGQVYKGAIFWDTEMFMYPFFLHTEPGVARELLRYRIRTLDGARRKARSEGTGYRGAFYAWESQESGDDACSYFNVGDPITGRELRTHFRDKQVHISGDVAIAMWSYFQHTKDDSLLREGGAEVILECARFYLSYAYYKRDKGRFEILDVIGPDEYHERVNNNAFTSQVAKETIRIALAVVDYLGQADEVLCKELIGRLDIEGELDEFRFALERLYVPEANADTRLIEQFDGYFRLKESTPAALKKKLVHPNEYLGAGQGLAVPTQVIKQADVVMMLHQFREQYDVATKEANWRYYEPRTEHGSSLSACAYSMVAMEFGELDFAYRYFLKTAKIDLEAKYKLYAGTIFIGGSHPAANGGAWMTAVLGFGGVSKGVDCLRIAPRLYPGWTRLQFPLSYAGDRFVVTATHERLVVTAAPNNDRTHEMELAGKRMSLVPGTTVSVSPQVEEARLARI